MDDEPQGPQPELDQRIPGTHLPSEAYRTLVGRARVPDSRWSDDDPSVRILMNGLRRWDPDERH